MIGYTWAGRWHDVAMNCSISREGGIAYPMVFETMTALAFQYPWEQEVTEIYCGTDLDVVTMG